MDLKYRFYKCKNCKHVQEIQTNHEGEVIDYCKSCSWKPSFGKYAVPFNGRTYRPFVIAKAKDLPKPRVGACRIYHGDDWSWGPLDAWTKSRYLSRHGREIYVGTRALGDSKTWNVWRSYEAGTGGPHDLYIAQPQRKRR